MSANGQVDIKISDDLIRPIIEAKVQAAIVEALSGDSGLVGKTISNALTMKVDSNGKVSDYTCSNKYTYLDYLCKSIIIEAADKAVRRWVEMRKPELEEEFLRQIQTKKTSKMLVRACVDGLANATKNKWRFSVVFPDGE